MKVWLIDDEALLLNCFSELLVDSGFDVVGLESAMDATPNPGDVMVVDVSAMKKFGLPKIDSSVKVIYISGDPNEEIVTLCKPFSIDDLVSKIKGV